MKFCPKCGARLGARTTGGRERSACVAEGCSFVSWDNPVPVVAAIIEHDGRALLVRQPSWPDKMFALVTGFLERGESPEDGVLREVKEEVGLAGTVVRFVGVYPFPQMNQLIVAYHVRTTGEVVLSDEIAEHKLVEIAKLRPWPFGTGHAVRDWLARHEGRLAR